MRLLDEIGEYAKERKAKYLEIRKERELTEEELEDYLSACNTLELVKSNDFVSQAWLKEMNRKFPNLNSFYD